jgi:uncharacterized membrane protein YdjX (TVP38/TMEM64 family)
MQRGRCEFMQPFTSLGVADRLRVRYPKASSDGRSSPVMVHSKLMVVDDDLLRVGSANINNRSMGADTECDLVFEATREDHRAFIRATRHRLIAHFCGASEQDIGDHEADLLLYLDGRSDEAGPIGLAPVDMSFSGDGEVGQFVQSIADPKEPLRLQQTARRVWTKKTALAVLAVIVSLGTLALVWNSNVLGGYTDVGFVSRLIASRPELGVLLAVAAFVIGGLVVFPVIVLIAATAAALGPWLGFFSALVGVLLSALVLFCVGRLLGQERLQSVLGARASRVQHAIVRKGIVAVALVRMVPVAPFSIVNLVAGASTLQLKDFLLGTALGMMPGMLVMSLLGAQIADLARNASWQGVVVLVLLLAAWIALCLCVQFVVTWLTRRRA